MKIALVTGGGRGLGKNAALQIARKGVGVVVTYNSNKDAAEAVVREIKSLGQRACAVHLNVGVVNSFGDFRRSLEETLEETFQSHKIDYLLNNAGVGGNFSIEDATEEQFDQLMNVNFKGVFFLTQKLLPLIKDEGRILNVSSGLTRFSYPSYGVYASMKGAVEVFTRYLAKELGGRRISVNCIAPGAIETDFSGGRIRDNKDLNVRIAAQTALGRVGLPEDIGGVMAELLVGNMGWLNGQRVEVSGGIHL